MRVISVLLLFLAFLNPAYAQESNLILVPDDMPPPVIMPATPDMMPMVLTGLDVDVRILSDLAETQMTMTFYNPNDRVLAGDFYFPLPEGALVSGYALDIKGKMVDGSVVKKHEARIAFEKEVRKGIDPGLVEYTKGNNYKTRIFPIPAHGTRTVRIRYISDLIYDSHGPHYVLPLNYKEPVKEVSLRGEAVKAAVAPTVTEGGLANVQFSKWRDSYVAETKMTDVLLNKSMIISVPSVETNPVVVEKGVDGQYYFYISDFPKKQSVLPDRIEPKYISVIWDASGSREKADHERELNILGAYLKRTLEEKPQLDVDLHVLRNTLKMAGNYKVTKETLNDLLSSIRSIQYDGGTQMGAIGAVDPSRRKEKVYSLYLIFTDGLSNFGKEKAGKLFGPAYIISSSPENNHAYLHYLASETGGRYFNAAAMKDEDIVSAIGVSPFSFLHYKSKGDKIGETFPSVTQAVNNRFPFVGKLEGNKAEVTLFYGSGSKVEQSKSFVIDAEQAVSGNTLRTYWAQQKINELMIHDPDNEKALTAVGQAYGLVTPGTSLIVLETLDQYVEHRIVPPASLPEMQQAYDEKIGQLQKQDKEQKDNKIERMVELWNSRIAWWETDFTPYHHKPSMLEKAILGIGDGISNSMEYGGVGAAADVEAEPNRASILSAAPDSSSSEPMEITEEALAETESDEMTDGAAKSKDEGMATPAGGEISIKPWNPDTPYLKALGAAKKEERMSVYFAQRKENGDKPSFFLDCAAFFFRENEDEMALQVLSNITEFELENPALMRIVAHRLEQAGEFELSRMMFDDVLELRPEEPQSYRDLALVLSKQEKYEQAIDLLYQVVLKDWDRFAEIELIALMELNRLIPEAKEAGVKAFNIDPRLIKLLDLDIRIVMTWDADMTDIDLWVLEPSGEKAYYGHNRTLIGGLVSRDFTQGYGPEEYLIKKAMKGTYKVQANYFGAGAPTVTGPVTLQLDIYSNYGRADEKHKAITLRLTDKKEVIDVGEVTF